MFEVVKSFLENVHSVTTIAELEALLDPVLDNYGIHHYICTSMYGLQCVPDRKPMFGSWDSGWVSHFVSNGYYLEDAVTFYNQGLEGDGRPFYWSELVAEKELTKIQCKIFAEAWDADLREGLVIPLIVSDRELALVSMAGKHFKQDSIIRGILHTISIQAHRQARTILMRDYNNGELMPNRLAAAPVPQIDKITPTELRIIALLAEDHRAPEIATLTGSSESTVRNHMGSAKKKLLVDNTEALVITALRYKLIS